MQTKGNGRVGGARLKVLQSSTLDKMVEEHIGKTTGYCAEIARIEVRTEKGDLAYKAKKNNTDIGLLKRNTTDYAYMLEWTGL